MTVLQSWVGTCSGATVLSAAPAANLTAGTKIICLGTFDKGTAESITALDDGNGNPGAQIDHYDWSITGQSDASDIWVMDTPAGDAGTKPTFNLHFSVSTFTTAVFLEVSGLAPGATAAACLDTATTPVGHSNGNTGVTSPFGPPAYTSTTSGEFLLYFLSDPYDGLTTWVGPSGYTIISDDATGATYGSIMVAYKNSTGGAETGQWSWTGGATDHPAATMVAFKLAGAAPTPVQSAKSVAVDNTTGGAPTATVTPATNVSAGNRLLLFTSHFGLQSNTDIPTPTDTLGLTWTLLGSNQVNDSLGSLHTLWVDLWTAEITAGGAITITITAPGGQPSGSNNIVGASLQEWGALSKAPTVGALDVIAAGTGLSNATGNVSTGTTSATHAAGQIAVAFAADWGSGLTWSVASGGFTKDTIASRDADNNASCVVAYKTSASGATEVATFSPSTGGIGSDIVGLVAVLQLQKVTTDTGTGADPILGFGAMAVPGDAGVGTDVTTSPITAPDTGTGIDTLAVLAPVNITDTGTGVDVAAPTVAFTQTDTGTGADIPATGSIGGVGPTGVTTITQTDTGTGADLVVQVGAVPTAALFDDFNAPARNAALWNAAGDTLQGPASGRLQLHATVGESLYRTVAIYTLEGSAVQIRFVAPPPASDASVTLGVTDGVNVAQIGWVNGPTPAIAVGWCNGPTWTTMAAVTYDPAVHGYWRLRADTIGTIFHETAPTAAGPWTTLYSGVPGWAPTAVTVIVAAATLTTNDGGWAQLDDVNVIGQSVLDAGTGADPGIAGPILIDNGAGVDTALTPSTFLAVADAGAGTETAPGITTFPGAEHGTGVDTLTVLGALTVADTGTGTDLVASNVIAVADTAAGIDPVVSIAFVRADQATGATDIAALSVNVSATETATGTELAPTITPRVADTGAGTETLNNTSPLATDAGAGSDLAVIRFPEADTGTGVDAATPSVTVIVADAGTGTDTLAVNAVAAAADTGTGTELPLAVTFTVPSEGAAGVDSLTIRVTVIDVGAGIELLVIQTTLTDLGAGGDTQTVFTGFSVVQADSGTGAEILALVKLLADTGTGADSTRGPGTVIPNFYRSYVRFYVRSSAGRTFTKVTVC